MATLINGNLNNPVYASQDADLLASICGNKTVVTPVGSQFAEELEDANTIKVDDGVIITKEGRRIQLDNGDIDEFLIPTGTQGQTNYYICGYHLYTDEESAELCETFVEPVSSSTDTIDEDTFRDGSTEVYVSLLRVKQEGVNITSITRLLPSGTDMNQINVDLSAKQDKLTNPLVQADIIDNLTSTSTTKPLSARQGKVLNEKIEDNTSLITNTNNRVNDNEYSVSNNIKNYTNFLAPFTVPHDGYIDAVMGGGIVNQTVSVTIMDSHGEPLTRMSSITQAADISGAQICVYVKKGMKAYCSYTGPGTPINNATVTYRGLTI